MKKNDIANLILLDREQKNKIIKNYSKNNLCISIKANIPGLNKNIYFARVIVEYFSDNVKKLLKTKKYGKIVLNGLDGILILFIIYDTDNTFENALNLKKIMINLEENEPIGRLVDLDVHYYDDTSIRRNNLRKCLICNDDAFVCNRFKKHDDLTIIRKISEITTAKLSKIIKSMIFESMKRELNLHPKFGLITPLTCGSHKDMDYNLMLKSIEYLSDSLYQLFQIGLLCDDLLALFSNIRLKGIEIEKELFEITGGINTYKGLIFGLGIILAASGYLLKNESNDFNDLFLIVKKMTGSLKEELICLTRNTKKTAGILAYQNYNLGGARLEAYNGFPSIQKVQLVDLSSNSLLQALIDLIVASEDTTTLKRAKSINEYYLIKEKFANLKIEDKKAVNQLNDYCIHNNFTFGGAADLLIIKIYIFMFKNYFFEEGGKNEKQKN